MLRKSKFNFSERAVNTILEAIRKGGARPDRLRSDEELPDPKDVVFYKTTFSVEDSYTVTSNINHFTRSNSW